MAASDFRYGVVGCAGMGENHADAVEDIEDATLVACADIDEGIARSFADAYDVAWYTDPAEMATDADLDIVSVCTPNGTHLEIVSDLAEAGVDILCEKPLEITRERVDQLINVCEREGITLGGIFQRRLYGGPQFAHEVVADGQLGDLVLGEVEVKWHRDQSYYEDIGWHGTTDLDGGVLLTQALHGIDLLQWTAGEIERVAAELDTVHHDVEVPDTAVASVEFTNGGYGQITGTTAMYPEERLSLNLHGTEGSFKWHEDELDLFETKAGAEATLEPFHMGTGIAGQVRDFVAAIRDDREPMIPPEEARKALDITFALEKAAQTDQWVDVEYGTRE